VLILGNRQGNPTKEAFMPEHEAFIPPAYIPVECRLAAHAFLAGEEVSEDLRAVLDDVVEDMQPPIEALIKLARERGSESRTWDSARRLLASRIAARMS
jgi:hypothetical protein